MSSYNFGLTLGNITSLVRMLLDIFIMWLVLYYAIKIVKNNSRTIQIFKGIVLILIVDAIAKFLGLSTVSWVVDMFINWGFLAIIIVFQPEIRSVLEKLGTSSVFSRISTLTGNEKEHLVDELVSATMLLSKDSTGALICLEQSHSLNEFIKTGTPLNANVTAELLTSIFVTSTPLHDGAVIIQGDHIACASAYFPPTNRNLPSRYGARHRAAVGISEITDSVTIVVSEETGAVSIAEGGQIQQVNRKQLREYLVRVICGTETEIHGSSNKAAKVTPASSNDSEYIVESTPKKAPAVVPVIEKRETKEIEEPIKAETIHTVTPEQKEEPTPVETPVVPVAKAEIPTPLQETIQEPKKLEVEKQEPKKHGLFGGLFGKKEEKKPTQEDLLLQEEKKREASIKLPAKKERPAPSYPERSETPVLFEKNVRVMGVEERKPAPESVSAIPHIGAEEGSAQEKVETETSNTTPTEQEVAMEKTVEEVSEKAVEAIEAEALTPAKEEQGEEEGKYNTTKIDLSSILKAQDSLDDQFAALDGLAQEPAVKDVVDIQKPQEDGTSQDDGKGGDRK